MFVKVVQPIVSTEARLAATIGFITSPVDGEVFILTAPFIEPRNRTCCCPHQFKQLLAPSTLLLREFLTLSQWREGCGYNQKSSALLTKFSAGFWVI